MCVARIHGSDKYVLSNTRDGAPCVVWAPPPQMPVRLCLHVALHAFNVVHKLLNVWHLCRVLLYVFVLLSTRRLGGGGMLFGRYVESHVFFVVVRVSGP